MTLRGKSSNRKDQVCQYLIGPCYNVFCFDLSHCILICEKKTRQLVHQHLFPKKARSSVEDMPVLHGLSAKVHWENDSAACISTKGKNMFHCFCAFALGIAIAQLLIDINLLPPKILQFPFSFLRAPSPVPCALFFKARGAIFIFVQGNQTTSPCEFIRIAAYLVFFFESTGKKLFQPMYKQEIGDKKEKIMQTGCSKFALPSANGKKLESGLRAQHFVKMCGTKYC